MKNLLIFLLFATPMAAQVDQPVVVAVYVENNEIILRSSDSTPHALTSDKLRKGFPVLSKDGSLIAFLRDIDARTALTNLVVITSGGHEMTSIDVKPVSSTGPRLMRAVEKIEWLTDSRLAVVGSVMPDLGEFLIYDISTGKVIKDEQIGGGGISFSPNGLHFAYIVGSPHFSPESSWMPTLVVDDRQVYPSPNNKVKFLGLPRWSPDSAMLAIAAKENDSDRNTIVVWRQPNKLLTSPLMTESNSVDLFWKSNQLIVRANDQEYQWNEAGNSLHDLGIATLKNPTTIAIELMQQLDSSIGKPPARDADYWCEACILSVLPRANPINRGEDVEESH
jgi:hypothetical protein